MMILQENATLWSLKSHGVPTALLISLPEQETGYTSTPLFRQGNHKL